MSILPKKKQSSHLQHRVNPSARRKARRFALQAMYQWQIAQLPLNQIEVQFLSDNDFSKVDESYFSALIRGVTKHVKQLDQKMSAVLDRPLNQLDPVELSALRIGCYELLDRMDVPYRIVINEAIELVKYFGAQDSHRYINGILDKLAPRLRADEVFAHRKKKGKCIKTRLSDAVAQ